MSKATIVPVFVAGLLSACAGSPPDYSQRTEFAALKQNELAAWLQQDANQSASRRIAAPVCVSAVGQPSTGWAIDNGNWCVVACPVPPVQSVKNQWSQTSNGARCFVTDQIPNAMVNTEFQSQDWQLDQLALFSGFDRSFVSDTEWNCIEQEYQIDPDTRQGFWVDIGAGNSYRFYSDGALMAARGTAPMKLAGDWRGSQDGGGVIANDRVMFRYAVNYGGGRFDEYSSATRKQRCRFIDHPKPRT